MPGAITDAGRVELLGLRSVAVDYGSQRALDQVSFSVGQGELIAVVGPNGAGKSTLFRAISGLIPHRGEVCLDGVACPFHSRQRAAFIPQRSDVDPEFPISVRELVAMGRRRQRGLFGRFGALDQALIDERLAQVGLLQLARSPIAQLSGGQLQRAFLARALVQGAELFLFDEALSGVDQAATNDLFDLFDTLVGQGASVLVATHDLALARRRFSRCLAINGALVADGSPADVFSTENLDATFGSGRLVTVA